MRMMLILPNFWFAGIDVQWGSGAYTKTGPSSGAQNNEATLNVDNHAVAPLHGTSYAESGIYLSEPSIADGTFLFDDDNDGDDLHAMLRQVLDFSVYSCVNFAFFSSY